MTDYFVVDQLTGKLRPATRKEHDDVVAESLARRRAKMEEREMKIYLVTIKLSRHAEHDPRNKLTDVCPIGDGTLCTNATGEHHTIVVVTEADVTIEDVRSEYINLVKHVTRVEEVDASVARQLTRRLR